MTELILKNVLDELSASLTHADVEQIKELIDAGELGIAFENFCTQLYERDAACSGLQLNQIEEIGRSMDIESSCWKNLRVI